MPYINQANRDVLARGSAPITPGELNYVVTRAVDDYLHSQGTHYSSINEVIGVLECAKLELYRRVAAPYEDKKAAVNGDVYTSKI